MTRKVCVVITARPSYSRIKTVLRAIEARPDLELQLVAAASLLLDRYGRAVDVIERDGFTPAAKIYMVLEGEHLSTMAKTTGLGMIELSSTLDRLQPDIVVTIADRHETLATAVAGSYMNIPVAHIQGGEVSGSIDEKVRHAVTKLSDLHLVASEKAAERVIRMGEDPDRVVVTGCPSVDLAAEILESPDLDFDPIEKYGGVGEPLDLNGGYLVTMQHPVTTEFRETRSQVLETLEAVHELGLPTLWFWPNVDAGSDGTSNTIRSFRENAKPENIHFFKNMEPHDFLRLIRNSRCLIGNSSVGIRESAFLGVPVVNIGSRQQGRERGANVIDVEHDRSQIRAAIERQVAHGRYASDPLYGSGDSGERIARELAEREVGIEKRLTY